MSERKTTEGVRIDNDKLITELAEFTTRTQVMAVATKALARPLLEQQQGARGFDQLRAEARYGKGSPEARARAAKAAEASRARDLFERQFEADLSEPPRTGPREAGVYGTITRRGKGQADLLVGVVDATGTWAGHACTDRFGGYSFTLDAAAKGVLRVQEKDGAPLYQDADPLPPLSEGRAIRRDVELDAVGYCPAPPPRPDDGTGDDDEPVTVTVPDLVGLSEERAVETLRKAGLNRGTRKTEPSDAETGSILAQTPEAGAAVAPATAVDIIVAEALVQRMPKVTGMPVSLARAALKDAGLSAVDEKTEEAPDAVGLVLAQDPEAGAEIGSATQVTLTVGVDPALVMPRLIGQKAKAAQQALLEMGLGTLSFEQKESRDGVGLVIAQAPDAGQRVTATTAVVLTVGVAPREGDGLVLVADRMARDDAMLRRRLSSERLTAILKDAGATSPDDLTELSKLNVDDFNAKLGLGNKAMATDIRAALRIALDRG